MPGITPGMPHPVAAFVADSIDAWDPTITPLEPAADSR